MRKQITVLTSALGCAALVAACSTTQPTPPKVPGCKTVSDQRAAGDRPAMAVSVLSPDIAEVIGIENVATTATANGLARIQVALYNCTDVDVMLQARTQFGSAAGQSEPPSAWKTVSLPPRARAVYTEIAVSEATTTLFVEVHDLNRGQSQFGPGQQYKKR